jgi:hypothetical protein
MNKIIINDIKYDVPTSWDEVSVYRFQNMRDITSSQTENAATTLHELKLVAALIGCDVDSLKRTKREVYNNLLVSLSFMSEVPKKNKKEQYVIQGVTYVRVKDLTQLTMGETIDLEMIISSSNDSDLTGNILPLLIRKGILDARNNCLKPDEVSKESYTQNKELFLHQLMITDVLFVVDFF